MSHDAIRKTSYKRNDHGAALMMTIILIGIILVFAFSLLLVSYTLYASQSKKVSSMRCSEAANSLSKALEDELTDDQAYSRSALWKYLRCNILIDNQTWPYYDEGAPGHGETEAFRYFDLTQNANYKDPVEGFPGSIKLCIYWTPSEDTLKGKLKTGSYKFDELPLNDRNNAVLYIRIVAESSGQTYVVTNKYLVTITELDVDNVSEDKSYRDAIKKITTTKYGDTSDYIYNPMKLSSSEGWETADKPIKLRERWDISFVSRE